MSLLKGAEPFLLQGGPQGVLLLHGFTGSPSEMKLLGQYLNLLGYTVLGPRLCGHGTNYREMAATSWPQWYGSVEDGYHLLSGLCAKVSVVGLSMGGLLAFTLAAEYRVEKLVSLSTPISIADKRLPFLPVYSMFRSYIPKKRRRYPGIDPLYAVNYDHTPLCCLKSLLALIEHVKKLLPLIEVPTLIVQSRSEHTVKPESAQYIYNHLGSKTKHLHWLNKSGHVVTLDIEREEVFARVADFLGRDNYGVRK